MTISTDESALERLRKTLDETTAWPCRYTFKFIVPQAEQTALVAVLDGADVQVRGSAQGNYVGVTAEMGVASAAQVTDVYRRAAAIKGIISL